MDAGRIDELRRRIDADPTSIAFAELAEEYRREGQVREAIALCRSGLARHPAYLSARVTLGRALIEVNDLPSAKAELEQVLRVAPTSLPGLRALADVYQRLGETEKAQSLLERASASAQEGLALHEARGDVERHFEPALAQTPVLAAGSEPTEALAVASEPVSDEAVVDGTPAQGAQRSPQEMLRAAQVAALERFLEGVEAASRRITSAPRR